MSDNDTEPHFHEESDRRKWLLHRVTSELLPTLDRSDWEPMVLGHIQRDRRKLRGSYYTAIMDHWESLVRGDLTALCTEMVRLDEYGIDMRNVSPFYGLLRHLLNEEQQPTDATPPGHYSTMLDGWQISARWRDGMGWKTFAARAGEQHQLGDFNVADPRSPEWMADVRAALNRAIDARIGERLDSTSIPQRLLAEGKTIVTTDADGNVVKHSPDGSSRIVDRVETERDAH